MFPKYIPSILFFYGVISRTTYPLSADAMNATYGTASTESDI